MRLYALLAQGLVELVGQAVADVQAGRELGESCLAVPAGLRAGTTCEMQKVWESRETSYSLSGSPVNRTTQKHTLAFTSKGGFPRGSNSYPLIHSILAKSRLRRQAVKGGIGLSANPPRGPRVYPSHR